MEWLWYFLLYSLLGFFLEAAYAVWRGKDPDRKCLLLLPLCPVYGLGACVVLLLPEAVQRAPFLLAALGGAAATGVEYVTAVFYERILRVSFWDYTGFPGSLRGRICIPFSCAWSLLLLPMVYWVHPGAVRLASLIPLPVSWAALAALLADLIVSAVILRYTRDVGSLRWYRQLPSLGFEK